MQLTVARLLTCSHAWECFRPGEEATNVSIGSRVRARRSALGLTQEDLAREVGVTHQHVSRIEGEQAAPSVDLVVRLSRVFGVTTDYLLTGDDRPALDLRGAIRGDPDLSAEAKRHLLGVVEELRRRRR